MRRLFTTAEASDLGLSAAALKWGEQTGRWRPVQRAVYADGPDAPTELDRQLAHVLCGGGVARGRLAGVLYGLDGVELGPPPPRDRRRLDHTVVGGVACTTGLQTLVDLAATLDDLTWEQALESALHKGLLTVAELEDALPALSAARTVGVTRIRRVLAGRPRGAPPTESLLETLMVQLARGVPSLPPLTRQRSFYDDHGFFVARPDLCAPEFGLFIELDGQQHKDQPVYDARRETALVALTGWLPGRFTWTEVVRLPTSTRRRLGALAAQARRRHNFDAANER